MFISLVLMILAILGVVILVLMFDNTLDECDELKRENRKLRWMNEGQRMAIEQMNNEIFALQMKEGS